MHDTDNYGICWEDFGLENRNRKCRSRSRHRNNRTLSKKIRWKLFPIFFSSNFWNQLLILFLDQTLPLKISQLGGLNGSSKLLSTLSQGCISREPNGEHRVWSTVARFRFEWKPFYRHHDPLLACQQRKDVVALLFQQKVNRITKVCAMFG